MQPTRPWQRRPLEAPAPPSAVGDPDDLPDELPDAESAADAARRGLAPLRPWGATGAAPAPPAVARPGGDSRLRPSNPDTVLGHLTLPETAAPRAESPSESPVGPAADVEPTATVEPAARAKPRPRATPAGATPPAESPKPAEPAYPWQRQDVDLDIKGAATWDPSDYADEDDDGGIKARGKKAARWLFARRDEDGPDAASEGTDVAQREAERREAERVEAERAETQRLEAARAEAARREAERVAAERAATERAEAARVEAARVEAERAEAARRKAERAEAERREAARVEAERAAAARAEAERLEAERAEAQRAEAARREAERAEAARVAAEQAAAEQAAAEQAAAEQAAAEQAAAASRPRPRPAPKVPTQPTADPAPPATEDAVEPAARPRPRPANAQAVAPAAPVASHDRDIARFLAASETQPGDDVREPKAKREKTARKPSPVLGMLRSRRLIRWLVLVAIVVIAFFGIRAFVVSPYYIPSASMEPTLHGCPNCNDDHILVDKISYRLHDPRASDIVVFDKPANAVVPEDVLIKRVVAIGKDKVALRNGAVFVNGARLDEPYVNDACGPNPSRPETGTSSWTVPDGDLFVMGDNRCNSTDSRTFGPIPVSSVVGRAWLIFWPLGRFGTID